MESLGGFETPRYVMHLIWQFCEQRYYFSKFTVLYQFFFHEIVFMDVDVEEFEVTLDEGTWTKWAENAKIQ